ncbi:MAG: pentapeptide repeat-containing protein [Alphaproteobacteria bacterium]|nr:pentapeptide repeat-containing protein [Alphaproteobacteria bacterium]
MERCDLRGADLRGSVFHRALLQEVEALRRPGRGGRLQRRPRPLPCPA